ncbi:PKD domain-containing protein [Candidatus Bipolaricaulota bacterium]
MKRSAPILALAILLVASIHAATGPFETYKTDRNVGFFYNTTDETFTGLRVTFAGPVEPVLTLGIGAELTLILNEEGVLTFSGSVPPGCAWEIDWPLDGPLIVDAAWLLEDGTEVAINVHAPMARLAIIMPPYAVQWCSSEDRIAFIPIEIGFDATRSIDPEGEPLTFYEWEWSDLVYLEGVRVVREFRSPGWYWVTLTVWDVEGFSDSVQRSFYIPPWRCDDD